MNQTWIWIIVAIPIIFSWYGAYQQLLLRKPFGNNPAPDWIMYCLLLVFGILFPFFFYSMKLITEVRDDGAYIRFLPFHFSFKYIPFAAIRSYEVRTYSPIMDYGGWGIRYGLKGKAYNISGNRGVFFEFTEGQKVRKLLIGSQIPEKLAEAVRSGIERQALCDSVLFQDLSLQKKNTEILRSLQ